jgi:hypothetical protein
VEKARGRKTQRVCLSVYTVTENVFSFPRLISTQTVAFWYTYFFTTMCSVNQKNYKTSAVQTRALTRMRCLYGLHAVISQPIVNKVGLGYLSICDVTSCGLLHSCTCVFVMVIYVRSYFASTVLTYVRVHACGRKYVNLYVCVYVRACACMNCACVVPYTSLCCRSYEYISRKNLAH